MHATIPRSSLRPKPVTRAGHSPGGLVLAQSRSQKPAEFDPVVARRRARPRPLSRGIHLQEPVPGCPRLSLALHVVTALSSPTPPLPLVPTHPSSSQRSYSCREEPSIERGYTRIPLPATLNPTVRPASLRSRPHPTTRRDRHQRRTAGEHSLAILATSVNHCPSERAALANARPTWFIVRSLSGLEDRRRLRDRDGVGLRLGKAGE